MLSAEFGKDNGWVSEYFFPGGGLANGNQHPREMSMVVPALFQARPKGFALSMQIMETKHGNDTILQDVQHQVIGKALESMTFGMKCNGINGHKISCFLDRLSESPVFNLKIIYSKI